ncbi:MAG: hypothetical protein RJA76_341 [Bacteroidota bacterium]|jgi:hypothetical protein
MKKIILLFFISMPLFSQKNALKINLSSLFINNYSISYERALSKHTTVLLNGRFMPNGMIPFADKLNTLVSDPGADFTKFNLGNQAYTIELRYYFGKKAQSGFYMAPYIRKNNFDFAVPISIDIEDPATRISTSNRAQFSGNLSGLSGGLLLGVQKHLSKVFVLDLWIIGAHAGIMKGNVIANLNPSINTLLQAELTKTIEEAKNDSPIPFEFSVSQDKVNFSANSIAPGIRGLGFNLGIKF